MLHGPGVGAGDVRPRLAVVAVLLGAHGDLDRHVEVLRADGRLQGLAAALALLHRVHVLGLHVEDLLRGVVEGGEPRVVAAVGEAAPQVEARRDLAGAVAGRAEAGLVHALVAGQVVALLGLLAGHVEQRLGLALLLRLDQRQPADDAEGLLLAHEALRGAAHVGKGARLALDGPADDGAILREGREALRGAALRPPLLHAVDLRELPVEDEGAAAQERAGAAALPLLDHDALQADDDVVREAAVLLLGPLAPERHAHAGGRVVREDDLTLHQLLAVLGGEGQDRLEARDDAAEVHGAGHGLRLNRLQVDKVELERLDARVVGLLDGGVLLEDDLVAVVAAVVLAIRDAQRALAEREALALLQPLRELVGGEAEEARADLAALVVEEVHAEDLALLVLAEGAHLALGRDARADGPARLVGGELADGKEGSHVVRGVGWHAKRCWGR
mmetsp:Transcript_39404/g.116852  ORF Transcript_39404/g.116852 Transcript_39404/m.116852 type:complete len:446 (+) Transcript_39404:374-1711(+)